MKKTNKSNACSLCWA